MHPIAEVSFGEWLKRRRRGMGLTQQQLAARINYSTIALKKIEAEERRPSPEIVERLAEFFDIPTHEREKFQRFARGDGQSAPASESEDTPWRDLSIFSRTNLPFQLSSFIGRSKELAKIAGLIASNRLATLVGPGGVGKTRLSLKIGEKVLGDYSQGVWFVELAPIADPSLLPHSIAIAIGLQDEPQRPVIDRLSDYLRGKKLLIILDNCEHILDACAQIADILLKKCPHLKILATSREALGIVGEAVYQVPSLQLPDRQQLLEKFREYESVRLFEERARLVRTDFSLTPENVFSIAKICTRLDGIPLAIELAAARVNMFSIEQMAAQLQENYEILTGGSRTAPPRHQTLRAAIDWSYGLLSPEERLFFSRISVFAGGFTLDAAEKIAVGGSVSRAQVIHLLGQLINKSLVTVRVRAEGLDSVTRYGLLETIREYAREKLDEFGETERVGQCHCDFFIAFAEQAAPRLKGAQQIKWLDRLEAEYDNLRTAWQWTHEIQDLETTLRLVEALFWFWNRRGYLSEGHVWLKRALAAAPALTRSARARLLYEAAYLDRAQGDFDGARKLVEQSIALWRTLDFEDKQGLPLALALLANLLRDGGDPRSARSLAEESVMLSREQGNAWNLALSLISLGMVLRDQEDYDLAQSSIEESVRIWRELGDLWGLAHALHYLALVAYRRGDYEVAYSLTEEVISIRRQFGDKHQIAYAIHNLGKFMLAQGNIDRARPFFDQSLVLFREVGDKSGFVLSLQYRGVFALLQGNDVQAQSFLEEGLKLAHETGPKWISSSYLLWLADVAADRGQLERAIRLCSAAKTHLDTVSSFLDAFEQAHYERIINLARFSLSENAFARVRAEGRAMTLEQAVAYAMEKLDV
ncbi:MAG TPA: tetratricopeptide repeat protein [Anaerolineales bacterium]|nr:tetratricopeptide repeat protein [Anaerolineales bacterium]